MKPYFFLLSIMASAALMAQNSTAPPCKMPWSQPATHIQSTSAYAVVTIDGSPADVKDKVGIFVGDEIRGIGNIVVNEGLAYMAATLIQGEQAELLTFKLWDESLCKVLDVALTANSKPGGSIGLPPNYLKLKAESNKAPTALALSKATVPENSAIGTVVGKFSATDPDAGDAFTYAVSGVDASFFKVQGDELRLALSPDYEAKIKLAITATVTDAGGKSFSKDFIITVTDVLEQAVISLPARLAFADTKINATAVKDLTIKNTGNIALNVTAITFPVGFTGDWQSGEIAAGSKKTVKVTFKPTATKDYAGTMTVTSNATAFSGTNTLAISGKGVLVTGITAKGGTSEPATAFPGLSIFPNPAEDVLNIKLPNQSPVNLQLTDVNGRVVYERKAVTDDELSIDVSGYKSGVYVLVLESGGKVEKRKVMIK